MRPPSPSRFKLAATSAVIGFVLGAMAMAMLAWRFSAFVADERRPGPAGDGQRPIQARAAPLAVPPPVSPPPAPDPDAPPAFEATPVAELRARRLTMPVEGATSDALRDSFSETRSGTHRHEAIDILAPRHTRVVAVDDGTVAKLFRSDAGGITVYQFDATANYVYYYAHLEGYAAGLAEGARITRKQVLGYVGTSGNAPKDTPHLHFAIFRLTDRKQWWEGMPIDPYQVLKW
jgi:murein DD-endopeptidase MepM/ murein hydrolase activator NlpD